MSHARRICVMFVAGLAGLLPAASVPLLGAEAADIRALERGYESQVRPLVEQFCVDCHSGDAPEADVDLQAFASFADVRAKPQTWQKVREMFDTGQMPPKDAEQPSDHEREILQTWVRDYLTAEAAARAGDPGKVVLRRLNNAQYTYTIRDLTGVDSLDPARQFPADGAAGEGFTNTGSALAMSPALVTKYLDAAKELAGHAVLLPEGIRFSPSSSRRDWTNECLHRIHEFYGRYTTSAATKTISLQGLQFQSNQAGLLPVEAYLAAIVAGRDDLLAGRTSLETLAREHSLNLRYLTTLWGALSAEPSEEPTPLIDRLRSRVRTANPADVPALAAEIAGWQQALWKFNVIGHIGRHFGGTRGPAKWMEAVTPLAARQDVRLKLAAPPGQQDVTLYLVASDAGDGHEHDFVVWENPRLIAPGRPDLPLRDLRTVVAALAAHREQIASTSAKCLAAAAQAGESVDRDALQELASRHDVDPTMLAAWFDCLGIGATQSIDGHLVEKMESSQGYDFIKGWIGADALSVVANSSDQHVRIPGNMQPHSVAVHPSPKLRVIVGWRSPVTETARIEGFVQHAHPECGNGVTWSLELRRGRARQQLAGGTTHGGAVVKIGPLENVAIGQSDVVALVVGPRDGNHSCDLTSIDLTIGTGQHEWNLAREVSPDILAGNPHADAFDNADVWHFYSEPDAAGSQMSLPAGSLLARWQLTSSAEEKQKLADALQKLLEQGPGDLPADAPDALLYHQLTSLSGLLVSALRDAVLSAPDNTAGADSLYGLDPALFGKHPAGASVDAQSLCVQAPATIEVRLPADLIEGCDFVTSGTLHAQTGSAGSVQLQVLTAPPAAVNLSPSVPVIVGDDSPARRRFEAAFEVMRRLFPAALCYAKIVPIDEVITLNLFYREDDALRRLMLDEDEAAELDRLWDELTYISQEPLLLVSAYEQLVEYATQDRPDKVQEFAPMRGPINDRAAAFRQRLVDTEPGHLDAVIAFAQRAYRRPLGENEARELRDFYAELRRQEIPHEEAIHLTLARVLASPAFLYRIEKPAPGATQQPVSDYELASRLSYFLWSSLPDEELLEVAASGRLHETDVLVGQMRRMCRDPKTRRLAAQFAAQWLHIYDFDQHDEKSERHFPEFAGLRGAMYEESIQFFTDLFQNDGSLLNLLDADYTFLNEDLAKHYGIPGVEGPQWRRVDGVRRYGRGGILTQASILSKQSGASRTSPILRGNWLSEVLLGEKLPRPPKNVPVLAETPPAGLTERQLIEKHSRDPACAKCHARIDPLGFALENFDAIGRFRDKDAAGLAIDAQTKLKDGTRLNGIDGLRNYLLGERRDDVVGQFTRKLLGYALGRSVQLSDEPLLAEMQAALKENDYRISTALEAVVRSRQFREIRGMATAAQE